MKISHNWLRLWVNPPVTATELAHKLNLAGLEAEAEPLLAHAISGVVVGRILSAERHPQADRLQVCMVDVGSGTTMQIVCGAPNARAGLCAPCALPGAKLPGGMEIKDAKLRGVDSSGMLCSAKELMLSDKSEGLLELDDSAQPGQAIEDYLGLDDQLITLELTPNRGDCLSIAGLARETAALYGLDVRQPAIDEVAVDSDVVMAVQVENALDCSRYAGRVMTGINPQARTPDWMRERLRRSGIRCIHPVVDITNYVMLELGQPMHAFDLAKLAGPVGVRRARAGETLKLLTGDTITMSNELLIVAADRPVALAGVMGGADSGVGEGTIDIFFESACFAPAAVAGTGRRHKLSSDAVYRYERGVDCCLQRLALERATQLTHDICGGRVGPITEVGQNPALPTSITLRHARLVKLLGHDIPADQVVALLQRLGIVLKATSPGVWQCQPPSWRYDLAIEPDLIEEVARLNGYEQIPTRPYLAALIPAAQSEQQRAVLRVKDLMVGRGWQEVVTYSFVDAKLQARLTPEFIGIALDNPIAETMGVMRTTLWSGLIPVWLHNHQRQTKRMRLFELAAVFHELDGKIVESNRLAGLAAGAARPEQWGLKSLAVDFYDIKADLEALFGAEAGNFEFTPGTHSALHPGRSAVILRNGVAIGHLGELHPRLVAELDLPAAPLLFDLDWQALRQVHVPLAQPVPEYPASRRDLAVVVDEAVTAQQIIDLARKAGGPALRQAFIFDVYRGQGLRDASKSVALGLIFQDFSRTLTIDDIELAVAAIAASLALDLGALMRE